MPDYKFQPSVTDEPLLGHEDVGTNDAIAGPLADGFALSQFSGAAGIQTMAGKASLGNAFASQMAGLTSAGSPSGETYSLPRDQLSGNVSQNSKKGFLDDLPFKVTDSPFKMPGDDSHSPYKKRIQIGNTPFGIDVGGKPLEPNIGFDLTFPFGKGGKKGKKGRK